MYIHHTLIFALALSACTATPAMVDRHKATCTDIGFVPGKGPYVACVERLTVLETRAQNDVLTSVTGIGLTAMLSQILWNARRKN